MTKISTSAYLLWAATFSCQAILLTLGRRLPLMIRVYLATEIVLSVCGVLVAVLLGQAFYFHAFVVAGLIDDSVSLLVLLSLFEMLRLRARKPWQSHWLPAGLIASALFFVLWNTELPLPELRNTPWRFFMSCTHVAWTWMAVVVCIVPFYCFLTASLPDRKLLLLFVGMALYVGVHAGTMDYLIAKRFSHSKLANAVSDYSYFFSLALWFAAIPSAPTDPQRALNREHNS